LSELPTGVVERLEFEGAEARYNAYHAAQHVVRYATMRALVTGKRVLDVACGAGYGVRLLSEWGAREVVGVDIAPRAIATAKRMFNGSGRIFLTGDAERLTEVLDGSEPFDVIVSFETIEHLAHPELLLQALSKLKAPSGIVAVSCPNDASHGNQLGDNPYHLSIYSFDEFRGLTEEHLGPATQWFLGAPIVGEANYPIGDQTVEDKHEEARTLIMTQPVNQALLLPSQAGLEVSASSCSHYVGVWGATMRPNAVFSAQSVRSFQEPWRAIEWLKGQAGRLEERASEHYEPEIARLEAVVAEHEKTRREWLEPELNRLSVALKEAIDRGEALRSDVQRLAEEAEEARCQEQRYKADIERLEAVIEEH
jgi:2-polyprenyl-3-methyl-5-hydroxy-6-metoxy-1,4-benzoquinol methylase